MENNPWVIFHGKLSMETFPKDNFTWKIIHGLLINQSDPYIIISEGGIRQVVSGESINKINRLKHSLMVSPSELNLNSQDIADIVAFLKTPPME